MFTHPSWASDRAASYERLEFLGDSVLELAIAKALYDRFPEASDGRLTFVGEEWTRGNYPRSFAFDPTGLFLYCCNQRADAITVFRVNRATGALSFTGQYAAVGNPSIIVFLDLG